MDILKELNERLQQLEGESIAEGIKAAIRHIEAAEKHYNRAVTEHDDEAFNDVIYRTNQAFEGMLKQAYEILTGKTGKGVTPNAIEKYFIENQEYKGRIMQLLNNYRQDWRNPSTHDHSLIFNDDEAILAISSVTAFTYILLGGIMEKVNFIKGSYAAQESITLHETGILTKISADLPIVSAIMSYYSEFFGKAFPNVLRPKEQEIIGSLGGYLTSVLPDLRISRDMHLNVGDPARADFIVSSKEENTVIEVKRPTKVISSVTVGYHQVLRYLELANWRRGILFIPSTNLSDSMKIVEIESIVNKEICKIHVISRYNEVSVYEALGLTRKT